MRPRPFFQYVIGSFVQLAPGVPMQRVIWRGKQLVPSITGRQPYEVPVYRLNNEHWDATTSMSYSQPYSRSDSTL